VQDKQRESPRNDDLIYEFAWWGKQRDLSEGTRGLTDIVGDEDCETRN